MGVSKEENEMTHYLSIELSTIGISQRGSCLFSAVEVNFLVLDHGWVHQKFTYMLIVLYAKSCLKHDKNMLECAWRA